MIEREISFYHNTYRKGPEGGQVLLLTNTPVNNIHSHISAQLFTLNTTLEFQTEGTLYAFIV